MTSTIKFDAETLRCIMDAKMALTGTRRENAVARNAAQTVDCSVFGGDIEVDSEGQELPSMSRRWNVLCMSADWLDHKIPQTGDSIQVAGYPEMKVIRVMQDPGVIDMLCRSTGEVSR